MDRRLRESVSRGDVHTFQRLIEEDKTMAWKTMNNNTILHLAARYGHLELSKEIVKLFPDMTSVENPDLETPLHGACREGHLEIAKLLLETDPWIAYKVNSRQESALFAACENGKIQVVKHLLTVYSQQLLMLELDMDTTSLHVSASSGYTEIVKEIVQARRDFVWKKDSNGWTALHLSCSKGHLDITRELLKLDSDLCLIQDKEGRIPLHWAVIRGRINIIDEIISLNLESIEMTTYKGETILHLGVKNNQYDVVRYLTETLDVSKLLNMRDCDGNTILHLATAGKLTAVVKYLLKMGIHVNELNQKGYTALDVVEADASNSGPLAIVPALQEAGAKRCDQLSPSFTDIEPLLNSRSKGMGRGAGTNKSTTSERRSQSQSQRKHVNHNLLSRRRRKQMDLHNQGLRNARKTIAIVAVLIATVTFSAGINPPGGFRQDTGKATRGDRAAFKVFISCNIVALFLSMGVVNVLVSVISFTRRNTMRLLTLTHKAMWVSSLFMISAYIAAVWTIMPSGRGSRWVSMELIVLGAGSTVVVFAVLGLLLARHWHGKYKWRKARQKKITDDQTTPNSSISRVEEMKATRNSKDNLSSTNSDVDSSDQGYHVY